MSNLETAAHNVANNFSVDGRQAALDPNWVLLILEVLENLLPLIKKCVEARQVKEAASKPSLIQRVLLRNNVRRTLGPQLFREKGDEVIAALLKTGGETSAEEIEALYEAV